MTRRFTLCIGLCPWTRLFHEPSEPSGQSDALCRTIYRWAKFVIVTGIDRKAGFHWVSSDTWSEDVDGLYSRLALFTQTYLEFSSSLVRDWRSIDDPLTQLLPKLKDCEVLLHVPVCFSGISNLQCFVVTSVCFLRALAWLCLHL